MIEQRPSVGRSVHYIVPGSSSCRAAVITDVGVDRPNGVPRVGLAVFDPSCPLFVRDVPLDERDHTVGTWHWPERV